MDQKKASQVRQEIRRTIKESNLLMDSEPQYSGKPEYLFRPDTKERITEQHRVSKK